MVLTRYRLFRNVKIALLAQTLILLSSESSSNKNKQGVDNDDQQKMEGFDIIGLTINFFRSTGNGILGPSSLKLTCSYTLAPGDNLYYINIQANINNTFVGIATFNPPGSSNPVFTDGGNYLKDRVNLTNPTSSATQAIITFNEIKCEDEKQYKCIIGYVNSGNILTTELTTSLAVKGNSAIPDNITIMSPQQGLQEGLSVSFTCTGNVGKPAGRFKWSKYRGPVSTDYTGVTTTTVQMPGSCIFNGISVFTTTLEAADNKAVIRCTVDQELATDTMYRETESLAVYYNVRNTLLTKCPDYPSYAAREGTVTLTCSAESNPIPTYKWYIQSDMNSVIGSGNKLEVATLLQNTGIYVCVASNSYNGKYFEETAVLAIKIVNSTTQTLSTTFTSDSIQLSYAQCYGIFVFKARKEKMYEDVNNELSERHVYSTMTTADQRRTGDSDRQADMSADRRRTGNSERQAEMSADQRRTRNSERQADMSADQRRTGNSERQSGHVYLTVT